MSTLRDVRERIFQPQPQIQLNRYEAALLIIDMQYYDAHPDYGICLKARQEEREEELRYYLDGLKTVVPNIRRLQDAFRQKGMEVIHTRIASLTRDGRDRSLQHKNAGIHVPWDSKGAKILTELRPMEDEIVFSKTAGGVFPSTNINYVLHNMGIKQLVVVGVVTHGCVESAVRDAVSWNYYVVLVEDACTSFTDNLHRNAIQELGVTQANVRRTDDVVHEIQALT
jgi:nicotinamidase-related amidase